MSTERDRCYRIASRRTVSLLFSSTTPSPPPPALFSRTSDRVRYATWFYAFADRRPPTFPKVCPASVPGNPGTLPVRAVVLNYTVLYVLCYRCVALASLLLLTWSSGLAEVLALVVGFSAMQALKCCCCPDRCANFQHGGVSRERGRVFCFSADNLLSRCGASNLSLIFDLTSPDMCIGGGAR